MKVKFNRWQFKANKTKDIKAYNNRKTAEHNFRLYITWATDLLKETAGELPPDGKYSTQSLRMHPDNNEYLRGYLYPWNWLNYSPVDDESVPLDEVWIDEDKVVETFTGVGNR